jgi:hypothetical protein
VLRTAERRSGSNEQEGPAAGGALPGRRASYGVEGDQTLAASTVAMQRGNSRMSKGFPE